jgi:phage tail-like protein
MPNSRENDPLSVFNFYLSLVNSPVFSDALVSPPANYQVAGFSECTGLEATVEVIDYKEGGVNDYVHKFPTRASFGNITLKRGIVSLSHELWSWHRDFVLGKGNRKDGLIYLLNEARAPAKVWKFKRGIPTKWVGPSLNASQSSVAIESLEIAHEGLILSEVGVGGGGGGGGGFGVGIEVGAGAGIEVGATVDIGVDLKI